MSMDYIGWAATAVVVGSYFCRASDAMKRMQMIGALIWAVYGLLIGARPVIAANLLVFVAAGWALTRSRSLQVFGIGGHALGGSKKKGPVQEILHKNQE
jgi:hypothetical protein